MPVSHFVPFGSVDPLGHPDRPWWRLEILDKRIRDRGRGFDRWVEWIRYRLVRRDGQAIKGQMLWDAWDSDPIDWSRFASDLDEMALRDEQIPLPRPTIQPFQIWLHEHEGRARRFVTNVSDQGRLELRPVDGYPMSFPITPQYLVWGPGAPWADPAALSRAV